MLLLLVGEERDALGLGRHGHDVLGVHHEARGGVATQVDVDEQVVVSGAQQAWHVFVLDGVEQLRLVYVTAERVSHTVVPQRADR